MILLLDDGGVMSVSDLVELHMSPVSLIARLSELEVPTGMHFRDL